ncbi:MAG: hypothetical protein HIU93_13100 [Acidobacteria bacterium]|nr:hypothetical protein [Acidobacteriota bacterium]
MVIRGANGNIIRQCHDAAPDLFLNRVGRGRLTLLGQSEVTADKNLSPGTEVGDGKIS